MMESAAKIVTAGGLPLQISLWAAVFFFVVGGTLGMLLKMIEVRNAWKTRPR
jgi:hypothetical protein